MCPVVGARRAKLSEAKDYEDELQITWSVS